VRRCRLIISSDHGNCEKIIGIFVELKSLIDGKRDCRFCIFGGWFKCQ